MVVFHGSIVSNTGPGCGNARKDYFNSLPVTVFPLMYSLAEVAGFVQKKLYRRDDIFF